jgi:hypothetical protein
MFTEIYIIFGNISFSRSCSVRVQFYHALNPIETK